MMNRTGIYIFLLVTTVFMCEGASAQVSFDLNEIHVSAKTLYVKPETLDRLVTRLKAIEKNVPVDQEDLLLETYRIIVEQYIANNHFSQAYQVMSRYLQLKEGILSGRFIRTVDSSEKSIEARRISDGTELMNLQNQVQQLQIDNDLLISKRLNFRKYFSFTIIVLSSIFALMLVRSALKLMNIKSKLKENRKIMHSKQRQALAGAFVVGIINQARQRIRSIEELSEDIKNTLQDKRTGNEKELNLAAGIKTQCRDIIKSLNSSGIDA